MSKEKVVIFGISDTAQLAHYYLTHDSDYQVEAFTVHQEFMPSVPFFEGKPVLPFEKIDKLCPPSDFKFFAPMMGTRMNHNRREVYQATKAKGYSFISYVSSKATTFNNIIGENCFILEDNTLQPYVGIGNNIIIWSGCHLGHHSEIHDHSFFTSHVVLSGHCTVGPYSWLGVNSTIRDGAFLAEGTLIGMGGCLTSKKTEPYSVYLGVPAKKIDKTSLEVNP